MFSRKIKYPPQVPVINNLTSTSTTSALSANQGRVLDVEISALGDLLAGVESSIPTVPTVVNNLSSDSETSTLSARQGKILKELIDDVVFPVGSVVAYSGSAAPTGWLECNGQSTIGHSVLAAIVGANVPDLRGEFIRGFDNSRGVDTGRTMLSTQAATRIGNITDQGRGVVIDNGDAPVAHGSSTNSGYAPTGVYMSGETLTPVRPRNIALMYIIKT